MPKEVRREAQMRVTHSNELVVEGTGLRGD